MMQSVAKKCQGLKQGRGTLNDHRIVRIIGADEPMPTGAVFMLPGSGTCHAMAERYIR